MQLIHHQPSLCRTALQHRTSHATTRRACMQRVVVVAPRATAQPHNSGRLGATPRPTPQSSTQQQQQLRSRAVTGQVRETSSNGVKEQQRIDNTREPAPEVQPAEAPKQQFNWFKAWYPVAIEQDLDPSLPQHAKVLGLDLAIWWDSKASTWRAFQDRCPHRLAPLSEGIVDAQSGDLYCNYHGWTFNGQGKCTSVPQLPQGQSLSSSRSCVTSYPTRCSEGLLWVWPDASPAALIESAAEDAWPGLAPEIDLLGDRAFSRAAVKHKWYCRDLPYPWLAAKENAFNDMSHDTVLHHGVSAFANRGNARPLQMRLAEITPVGYRVTEASGAFSDITRFPCGARRERPGHAGIAYVVPTGVGTCRQFHTFLQNDAAETAAAAAGLPLPANTSSSSNKSLQARLGELQVWLRGNKPTWMQHMFAHVLIDADIAIQARVDYNRAVNDHVYMPAAADAGPSSFMRWLKEYGGGGPPVTKLKDPFMGHTPSVVQDRRQLLDRFAQHTQHCKACRTAYGHASTALRVTGILALISASAALVMAGLAASGSVLVAQAAATAAAGAAAPALVGAASAQVAASSSWGLAGVMVVVAGLLGGAYVALRQLVQKFVFVDYDKHHCGKQPS